MAKFRWNKRWFRQMEEAMREAIPLIGLGIESRAKRNLRKGRGVVTGTLRRSIHTATPGYPWPQDDVPRSRKTPERGGRPAEPEERGRGFVIQVGSGMHYAIYVEKRYGYLQNAVDWMRGKRAHRILGRVIRRRGLVR